MIFHISYDSRFWFAGVLTSSLFGFGQMELSRQEMEQERLKLTKLRSHQLSILSHASVIGQIATLVKDTL